MIEAHSQMASVFLFIQCTRVCVQILIGSTSVSLFSTFLSFVLVVTHCQAGEL